jgi:microcompartment protein CcmK/EutM
MLIGHVIGKVILNEQPPSFKGGRWLMVNPLERGQLRDACEKPPTLSERPTLVAYDSLGAREGDIVGIEEGYEVTERSDEPIPTDAICVAIFESITYQPAN